MKVQNPILTGFNPDPSILRVGEDYYIATSTFEWFPGVQIHHSKNLKDWELICHPLDRVSQLDMEGVMNSGGIWAPCLSWDGKLFYLIYTNVLTNGGAFMDPKNYLVTAPDIMGPWSDPVFLNASGFDPSLFHDEDGRKWLVNMRYDYRCSHTFSGIVLQEYSVEEKKLTGKPRLISKGTAIRTSEGPHLYKKDGWYYLMLAEGGTGYEHAMTMQRSRNIDGPYEDSPYNPVITSADHEELAIQKAGHASMTDTASGDWYIVHLCGRPVGADRNCILGRETSLQKAEWTQDGWLRLANGLHVPDEYTEVPDMPEHFVSRDMKEDFDGDGWSIHLNSLRKPLGKLASLKERPGYLRLYGGDSLQSLYSQSMLAHRQQAFYTETVTKVDFHPESFQQMAGLVYYYDTISFYYCHVTRDEEKGRVLNVMASVLNQKYFPIGHGISIPEEGEIWIRLETRRETAQFYYSLDGVHFEPVGPVLDAAVLSDDYYQRIGQWRFTGAFIGVCCQDMDRKTAHADFDFLYYTEKEK